MGRVALDFASNMSYGDGPSLRAFALTHRLAHNEFANALVALNGFQTPNFDVADERATGAWELVMIERDKVPQGAKQSLDAWLLLHANLTQAEYDALGLGLAYDLSTVDFGNASEFYVWMQQHQLVHAIVADALGIIT